MCDYNSLHFLDFEWGTGKVIKFIPAHFLGLSQWHIQSLGILWAALWIGSYDPWSFRSLLSAPPDPLQCIWIAKSQVDGCLPHLFAEISMFYCLYMFVRKYIKQFNSPCWSVALVSMHGWRQSSRHRGMDDRVCWWPAGSVSHTLPLPYIYNLQSTALGTRCILSVAAVTDKTRTN